MNYRQDLTGKKLGSLTVICYAGHNKGKKRTWLCRCDCGAESVVMTAQLNRQTGTCYHCRTKNLNEIRKLPEYDDSKWIGKKYGSLTVTEFAGHRYKKRMYRCLCDCGKESITNTFQLGKRTGACVHCKLIKKWEPVFEDEICKVPLSNSNDFALIDSEDFSKVEGYTWALNSNDYVVNRRYKQSPIWLHRLIMDAPDNKQVDHIHHCKLDNRKSELRLVTSSQNHWNRQNDPGVFFVKADNKFRARIMVNYNEIHLGQYDDYDTALKVRKEAEITYYGEYRNK